MSSTTSVVIGRAIVGLRWVAAYRIATQVFTWAVTILVVRLLSPEDYGLMAMAGIALNLAAVFDDFGLGTALVQRPRVRSDICHGVYGVVLIVAFVFAVGLWLVAKPLAMVMNEPDVVSIVQVASLAVAFNIIGSPARSLLARHSRFATLGAIDLLASVAASLTSLSMAWAGYGFWALVGASLVNSGLRVSLLLWLSPCRFKVRFDNFVAILPLAKFGGQISIARFCSYGSFNFDKALVGRVLGSDALGIFAVAQQLAWIPVDKGMSMLTQVAYPAFARLSVTEGQGRSQIVRLLAFNTAVFLPLMWTAAVVAVPVLPAVLGSQWAGAAPALAGFAVIIPLYMIHSLLQLAVTARGRGDVLLRNSATIMLVTIAGVAAGVSAGLGGAIIGWVSGFAAGWAWSARRSANCLGIPLWSIARLVLLPSAATLIPGGILGIVLLSGTPEGAILASLAGAASLGVAYLLFAALDRSSAREILTLMRRFLRRAPGLASSPEVAPDRSD